MHVAVTGVSGFIGSTIARHLSEAGHTVTGLVRPTSRTDHIKAVTDRLVVADQADDRVWPTLLDGADCVIHNSVDWQPLKPPADLNRHLQSNLLGSIRLLDAAAPRPFIFISSIAVHHDIRPRWKGRVDEDHPLRPVGLYGAYKAAVEAHLWDAHFRLGQCTSAIRPCGVYGIDPRLERSVGYPIVQQIKRGKPVARMGGGKFVHVDDVAAAVLATLGNEDAAGRAFNLADCYARWADWAQMTAELLGVEADIDFSSPSQPNNVFTKDAAQSLGISLDRGHEGIRRHLRDVIDRMAD